MDTCISTVQHLRRMMDLGEIWRCAAQVPKEWYEYDVSGINRLIEIHFRTGQRGRRTNGRPFKLRRTAKTT